MVSIQEIKDYLGIDGSHSDSLLSSMLTASRELIEGILRFPIGKIEPLPALVTEALKFTVAYLYTGREQADIQTLEKTLRTMLQSLRAKSF